MFLIARGKKRLNCFINKVQSEVAPGWVQKPKAASQTEILFVLPYDSEHNSFCLHAVASWHKIVAVDLGVKPILDNVQGGRREEKGLQSDASLLQSWRKIILRNLLLPSQTLHVSSQGVHNQTNYWQI